MFIKRKHRREEPESRKITPDFLRRPEYEACRAPEYRVYPKLEEARLLPLLDAHLEALFAGTVDDANGDMLDGIIFAPAREAVPDLIRQRCDHADVLRRLIARRKADREDFGRILEARRQELAELEADHEKTCRRIAACLGEVL